MNTSNKVEKYRKVLYRLNLKQAELATKLNVSAQRISDVVNGRSSFTEEQYVKLKRLFNINLNWLLDDENKNEGEMFISDGSKEEGFDKKVEQKVYEILRQQGLTK